MDLFVKYYKFMYFCNDSLIYSFLPAPKHQYKVHKEDYEEEEKEKEKVKQV